MCQLLLLLYQLLYHWKPIQLSQNYYHEWLFACVSAKTRSVLLLQTWSQARVSHRLKSGELQVSCNLSLKKEEKKSFLYSNKCKPTFNFLILFFQWTPLWRFISQNIAGVASCYLFVVFTLIRLWFMCSWQLMPALPPGFREFQEREPCRMLSMPCESSNYAIALRFRAEAIRA